MCNVPSKMEQKKSKMPKFNCDISELQLPFPLICSSLKTEGRGISVLQLHGSFDPKREQVR